MAGPEKKIEQRFIKLVEELGCMQVKLQRLGVPGWPDRLIAMPGGACVFVELKAPGEELSKIQQHVHGRLRDLGQAVATFDDAEAAAEWVRHAMIASAVQRDRAARAKAQSEPYGWFGGSVNTKLAKETVKAERRNKR